MDYPYYKLATKLLANISKEIYTTIADAILQEHVDGDILNGKWELSTFGENPTIDLHKIADQVRQGYNAGQLVHGSWVLTIKTWDAS